MQRPRRVVGVNARSIAARARTNGDTKVLMLDSLFCDGTVTGLTDHELLERFQTCRDRSGEVAFTALVRRHGPMVMNVCRRMLRDPADADDAFQATFLVLVRRAGEIRVATSLGPWLYGVSVRIARRARDHKTSRAMSELDHEVAGSLASDSPGDRDLRMAVDEAVARLPAPFRAAIVLCYLQGLTHAEAAGQLRCPVGTVRSRLARGRTLLKAHLERSELAPEVRPSNILLMLTLDRTRAVLTPSLIEITARTAARLAVGQALATTVSARLEELVAGATSTMTSLKWAGALSFVLFGGLATWCALAVAAQGPITTVRPAPANTAILPLAAQSLTQTARKSGAGNAQRPSQETLAIPDDLPPVVVNVEPKLALRTLIQPLAKFASHSARP